MEDAFFGDDRSTLTSAEQEVILSSPTPVNEVTVTCEKSVGDDAIIREDAFFGDDRSTLTSAEQEVILSSPTPVNEVTVTCEKSVGDDAIIREDAFFGDDRSTLTPLSTDTTMAMDRGRAYLTPLSQGLDFPPLEIFPSPSNQGTTLVPVTQELIFTPLEQDVTSWPPSAASSEIEVFSEEQDSNDIVTPIDLASDDDNSLASTNSDQENASLCSTPTPNNPAEVDALALFTPSDQDEHSLCSTPTPNNPAEVDALALFTPSDQDEHSLCSTAVAQNSNKTTTTVEVNDDKETVSFMVNISLKDISLTKPHPVDPENKSVELNVITSAPVRKRPREDEYAYQLSDATDDSGSGNESDPDYIAPKHALKTLSVYQSADEPQKKKRKYSKKRTKDSLCADNRVVHTISSTSVISEDPKRNDSSVHIDNMYTINESDLDREALIDNDNGDSTSQNQPEESIIIAAKEISTDISALDQMADKHYEDAVLRAPVISDSHKSTANDQRPSSLAVAAVTDSSSGSLGLDSFVTPTGFMPEESSNALQSMLENSNSIANGILPDTGASENNTLLPDAQEVTTSANKAAKVNDLSVVQANNDQDFANAMAIAMEDCNNEIPPITGYNQIMPQERMPMNSMGATMMPSNMMGAMPSNMMGAMPPNMMGAMPSNMMGAMPSNMMGAMPSNMMGAMPSNMMGAMPSNMMGAMPPNMMGAMPPNMMNMMSAMPTSIAFQQMMNLVLQQMASSMIAMYTQYYPANDFSQQGMSAIGNQDNVARAQASYYAPQSVVSDIQASANPVNHGTPQSVMSDIQASANPANQCAPQSVVSDIQASANPVNHGTPQSVASDIQASANPVNHGTPQSVASDIQASANPVNHGTPQSVASDIQASASPANQCTPQSVVSDIQASASPMNHGTPQSVMSDIQASASPINHGTPQSVMSDIQASANPANQCAPQPVMSDE